MKRLLTLCLLCSLLAPLPAAETSASPFVVQAVGDIAPADQKKIVDALEARYEQIGVDLKTTPARPFQVFIYSTQGAYIRATGNRNASGSIEGADKLHLVQQSRNGDRPETVAVHEFAHAVTLKLLTDHEPQPLDAPKFDRKFTTFPVWLWEAIAAFEAHQFIQPKSLFFINQTSYPSLDELSDRSKGGKIYKIGYCIVEYILSRYGRNGLITLILAYGDLAVLKTTPDEFGKAWHAFVVKKYFR